MKTSFLSVSVFTWFFACSVFAESSPEIPEVKIDAARAKSCDTAFSIETVIGALTSVEETDDRITNLSKQDWWREKIRGAEQPAHFEYLRTQRFFLREAIRNANVASAISIVNLLFQKVERAVLIIKGAEKALAMDLEEMMKDHGEGSGARLRDQLFKLYNQQKDVLAADYDEYANLRQILDDAVKKEEETSTDETARDTAKYIDNLIAGKMKQTLASMYMFGLRTDRPTLAEVKEIFSQSHEIQVKRDNLITSKERRAGLGALALYIFGGRNSALHKIIATRVPGIGKMVHEDLCLAVYYPRIESFINLGEKAKPMEEHYRFLFINYGSDGLAFLTAYFRHPETLAYHADVLKFAAEPGQIGKDSFQKALIKANAKAAAWGALSPSRRLKTWARKVPIVVTAIGLGLSVAYNNWFTVDEFTPVDLRLPGVEAPLHPGDRPDVHVPPVAGDPAQDDEDDITSEASVIESTDGVTVEEVETPAEIQNPR